MRREVLAVLVAVALVAGISTPMFVEYAFKGFTEPTPSPGITPVPAALTGLKTFASYEELAAFLVNASKHRQMATDMYSTYVEEALSQLGLPELPTPLPLISEDRVSKTNVQVIGVDESDVVKCDGKLMAVASDRNVFVIGVAEKAVLSKLSLDEPVNGLFLHGSTLTVITQSLIYRPLSVQVPEPVKQAFVVPAKTVNTTVHLYDLTEPRRPLLKGRVSVTGSVLSSRLNGKYLYVVASMPIDGLAIPLVNGEPLPVESIGAVDPVPTSYTTILALDVDEAEYSTYSFMVGFNNWLYMSPSRLYLAGTQAPDVVDAYRELASIVLKYLLSEVASKVSEHLSQGDVKRGLDVIVEYLRGLTEEEASKLLDQVAKELSETILSEKTVFYVFDVDGVNVKLRGRFEVEGRLLEQFSMEEEGSHFIVATTSTKYTVRPGYVAPLVIHPEPTPIEQEIKVVEYRDSQRIEKTVTITVAEETPLKPKVQLLLYVYPAPLSTENNVFIVDVEGLKVVGELRGLAKGERVFAARLIKDVFFLVTFRQVDPLFAIDVSDPANPKVLGYLKIPGFSDYLHPLPGDKLLGIGREEDMLKVSLFDTSDPTEMAETSKVELEAWSIALQDHHAVTVDLDNKLVFIPVSSGSASGIAVLSFNGGALTLVKIIGHQEAERTVYVGDELYTVSSMLVKVFRIGDFAQIGEIELR